MNIYYIDLFSGAGGTTTGIHLVGNNVKVVACVNHDRNAIESHKANHPDCLHFIEDVRDWAVIQALKKLVNDLRKKEPDCLIALWASLECTNYSKAKGGQPRNGDSRTLGLALYRKWSMKQKRFIKGNGYIQELKPDIIDIENVREFMAWGPLDEKGKPVSKLNGRDYLRWIKAIKDLGYNYDWRMLNAADFGAYTSKDRYFGQFTKKGLPIVWPEQTHSKEIKENTLFRNLEKWKPVKEVLDLDDEGESVFKNPKCEKTMQRYLAGLVKFVANGDDNTFLAAYYSTGDNVSSIGSPCPTVPTKDRFQKVQPVFMIDYQYKSDAHSIENPCPTVLTKDKFAKVQTVFMDQQFSNSTPHSLEQPTGAILTNPKQNLVTTKKWHYLVNPSWFGALSSVEKPSPTIIARQDKAPISIVEATEGKNRPFFAIPLFENKESETWTKIRVFMALHGIVDVKSRMLKIPELKKIMGFPEDYVLKGSQTQQKKYIGNAVVPQIAKAIISAKVSALTEPSIKKQVV